MISHFVPGTPKLDHKIFNHEAAFLKLDSSVATCKVTPEGKALYKGQEKIGLLDNGPETLWDDLKPRLHHPLPFQASFIRRNILSRPFYATLTLILIYLLIRVFLAIKRRKVT